MSLTAARPSEGGKDAASPPVPRAPINMRRALQRCFWCSRPLQRGEAYYCDQCRRNYNALTNNRRAVLRALGICIDCRKEPASGSYGEVCLARRRLARQVKAGLAQSRQRWRPSKPHQELEVGR